MNNKVTVKKIEMKSVNFRHKFTIIFSSPFYYVIQKYEMWRETTNDRVDNYDEKPTQ